MSALNPDDSLLLILRRLDEIERKLDRIMEGKQPSAIRHGEAMASLAAVITRPCVNYGQNSLIFPL